LRPRELSEGHSQRIVRGTLPENCSQNIRTGHERQALRDRSRPPSPSAEDHSRQPTAGSPQPAAHSRQPTAGSRPPSRTPQTLMQQFGGMEVPPSFVSTPFETPFPTTPHDHHAWIENLAEAMSFQEANVEESLRREQEEYSA